MVVTPGSIQRYRNAPATQRELHAFGGAGLAIGLAISLVAPPADAQQFGLDQRPSNTACLAPLLATGSTDVRGIRAFAPLTFTAPTQIRQHRSASERFYVSERRGVIRSFRMTGSGAVDDEVALDIRNRMANTVTTDSSDSEQWGIMSFAFHPDFDDRGGFLFVAYNRKASPSQPVRSTVSRFTSSNGRTFDPASERVLLSIEQDRPWHHVGQLQIGPDRALYVGSGDGGLSSRAQDSGELRGKILRIAIDASPPEVSIFARGVRNPWRFAFDAGELWIGDVGRNTWEEINRVDRAGQNLGWAIYEGEECLISSSCKTPGLTPPVHVFGHEVGAAVIGGQVYRGSSMPALRGHYVFGVSSNPELFALTPDSNFSRRVKIGQLPSGRATGFFRDSDGEIFVIDTITDSIWRLVPATSEPDGREVAELLSDTGCMSSVNTEKFASGVVPYDVNMPLWSDDLGKRRGVALANSATIRVDGSGDLFLPERSVLLKSFYIGDRIIETRLFMNHPGASGGWRGYSYEWAGSDAALLSAGKVKTFPTVDGPVTWQYPSREQCFECHTPAAGISLGLELRQLDGNFTYPSTGRTANQLETWRHIGMFTGSVPDASEVEALATRDTGTAEKRARSYLHANCSYCHRPNGTARVNIDFRFGIPVADMNVCNVAPTGELRIPGTFRVRPDDPSESMIPIRMRRRDDFQMPPLGTFVVDRQLATTISNWIRLPGLCDD